MVDAAGNSNKAFSVQMWAQLKACREQKELNQWKTEVWVTFLMGLRGSWVTGFETILLDYMLRLKLWFRDAKLTKLILNKGFSHVKWKQSVLACYSNFTMSVLVHGLLTSIRAQFLLPLIFLVLWTIKSKISFYASKTVWSRVHCVCVYVVAF